MFGRISLFQRRRPSIKIGALLSSTRAKPVVKRLSPQLTSGLDWTLQLATTGLARIRLQESRRLAKGHGMSPGCSGRQKVKGRFQDDLHDSFRWRVGQDAAPSALRQEVHVDVSLPEPRQMLVGTEQPQRAIMMHDELAIARGTGNAWEHRIALLPPTFANHGWPVDPLPRSATLQPPCSACGAWPLPQPARPAFQWLQLWGGREGGSNPPMHL